jgi:hypothetical protein
MTIRQMKKGAVGALFFAGHGDYFSSVCSMNFNCA